MNTSDRRVECARQLTSLITKAAGFTAFVGLDGFVDEIVHAVDQRENAQEYTRLPTITRFAEPVAGAAGRSTNIVLVVHRLILGGNGPIMANPLAALGSNVAYAGALSYPN